ncbi:LOW QUALITY PROTEIN: hypothetical protein PanWU01x14_199060, partial [Parasponia andersonii]
SQASSFSSSFSTQSAPPRINETLTTDEVLGESTGEETEAQGSY